MPSIIKDAISGNLQTLPKNEIRSFGLNLKVTTTHYPVCCHKLFLRLSICTVAYICILAVLKIYSHLKISTNAKRVV